MQTGQEKEETTKGQRGQECSPMWAPDESATHRRAFKSVHMLSLVAEKKGGEGLKSNRLGKQIRKLLVN